LIELLPAFLRISSGETERMRALRALTLHMLESHAPRFFHDRQLESELSLAVEALGEIPALFEPDLDPEDAMARIDAWYVRAERKLPHPSPDRETLRAYLASLCDSGYLIYGWLLGEMARSLGVDARAGIPNRPFKSSSRLLDLYWLTHLYLIETRFLRRRLPRIGWDGRTKEIVLASYWIVGQHHVDLGAEAAVCLQLAGMRSSGQHQALLDLITEHCQADGSVIDPSIDESEENTAHCTAASLIALAGAAEFS
jgi:D-amino peptidase